MNEEKLATPREASHYGIRKLEDGFLVIGDEYAGDTLHAFSTPEGLIEWLSRELGAGPIVWALTLDIWQKVVGIGEDELLPLPEQTTDPRRYQETLEMNAKVIFTRFLQVLQEEEKPEPPPEPQKVKVKKANKEEPKEEGKKE